MFSNEICWGYDTLSFLTYDTFLICGSVSYEFCFSLFYVSLTFL